MPAPLLFFWPLSPVEAAVCTFDSGPAVAFGNYDVTSTNPTDSVGSIDITCDKTPKSGTISLSAGAGTYAQRRMINGGQSLNYNLYTSSARTQIWGDGSAGTASVPFTQTSNSIPVYGRIPALQSIQPGLYSDSIVVTITF